MKDSALRRLPAIFYFAIVLSILILAVCLAVFLTAEEPQTRIVFSDISSPLVNILATAALFLAAYRSRAISKRLQTAWLLFALAQLVFTIGDIAWAVLELGLGEAPFPSIADGWYLAYYPLFLIGAIVLPGSRKSAQEWLKPGLDMGIILLAAILGFWNFLIGHLLAAGAENPLLTQLLTLAYPVSDVVLFGAILLLLYNQTDAHSETPVRLLIIGLMAMLVTDCIFSYQSLIGTYESGKFVDIGWYVTYVLTGLAGVYQAFVVCPSQKSSPSPTRPKSAAHGLAQAFLTYFPYAWVVLAYLLLVLSNRVDLPMKFSELAVGVGILIGLVIARQIIALSENNRLFTRLQKVMTHVQQQTDTLEKTNRELQVEIGERKRAEEQLSYDALHDALTFLPNRALLMDRLERAIEYSRRRPDYPFSVLLLDLDQFKVINDSMGHPTGDQLLISIAHRLSGSVRASDTVARLGGDEFVVLLENTPNENAIAFVANCILADLKKPFNLNGQEVFVSASIGIVKSVLNYLKPDDVLRDADTAMYAAKAMGKARFEFFHDGLRTQAISRLELENELRQAIEQQEFELYYQPIIRLANAEITSCEALIRWRHPRRGLVLPGDFIGVAEESGLILPIGRWVLLEACLQLKKWHDTYPDMQKLAVNVNISGKQFTQPDFVDQVRQALDRTGLQAECLKLEITETVLIDNYATANTKFQELLRIGVQLQIDDFGTGYSSLGYLQHFPVHAIKIDKSFVREMGHGKRGSDLIRAMISMAHDLGMDTIAEGIETDDQLAELKSQACRYGQGYLFSCPVDHIALEKFLQTPIPLFMKVESRV